MDEAVAALERAIRLRPENAEAYNNLGSALRDLGRLDEAIANYRQAVLLKPNVAETHSNLGMAAQGQLEEEAVASCRRSVSLSPGYAAGYNNLGNALQMQGKLEEAVANWRWTETPTLPRHTTTLATRCTIWAGSRKRSPAAGGGAAAQNPISGGSQQSRHVLENSGKTEEALSSYRQALRLKPNYAEVHNNLGLALTELGRMDEALASVQETLRLQAEARRGPKASWRGCRAANCLKRTAPHPRTATGRLGPPRLRASQNCSLGSRKCVMPGASMNRPPPCCDRPTPFPWNYAARKDTLTMAMTMHILCKT